MWLGGGWLGTVWRWWVPGLSCPLHWPSELWQEALLAAAVAGGDANDRTNALITTEGEKRERVNRGREGCRKMEHRTERRKRGKIWGSDELWVTAVWHDWAVSRRRYLHHLLQQHPTQQQCYHRERGGQVWPKQTSVWMAWVCLYACMCVCMC